MVMVNREHWDAALDALKPSSRDLEYGLKLHRESIVCESYGFSPRAHVPAAGLRKLVAEKATGLEIRKYLVEMMVLNYLLDPDEWEKYQRAFDQSGVTCILQNAGEEVQNPLYILERLARYNFVTEVKKDFVFKAIVPEDIERAKKENKHCLYLMSNGVPLAQRWDSVEEELYPLHLFFMLGIRMMHLTYNRRNLLGDGCGEPANGGLSDLGRLAVKEMNRTGIIVDIAHSGEQTGLDAVKSSSTPVVASHSACSAINEHCRCKSDRLIKAVADNGGYVGICCIQSFIGGDGGIKTFLDHIDHVCKKFGPDHAAIGTDVTYTSPGKGKANEKYPPVPPLKPKWEGLWPEYRVSDATRRKYTKTAPTLSWTNWPLFTVGMVQRGYKDEDIRKVLGGNVLRVAKAAIKKSEFFPPPGK